MSGSNTIVNALIITVTAWFGSYLYYYLWVIYGVPQPLYGYLLFIPAVLVVVMMVWWSNERLLGAAAEQKRYLMFWLLLYAAYGVFAFLRSAQDQLAYEALVDVAKAVLLTGGFSLLLRQTNHLSVSEKGFLFLVIFSSIANILDFFRLMVSTELSVDVPGRGAGLYINPNIAGSFIVFFMIPAIRPLRPLWRVGLVLIAGIGVSVTFSREAWIMWGFAVLVLGWLGYFSRRYRMVTALFGAVLAVGLVLALLFGGAAGIVERTGIDQYLTYGTAQRLGLWNDGQFDDSSVRLRLNLIERSLHEAADHPFAGNGLGSTANWHSSQGPENMYLLFLVEGGVAGVLLYLSMLAILWTSADRLGKVLVTAIVIASLFSHHLLRQPVFMLLIGYVVSSAAFSDAKTHAPFFARSRVEDEPLFAGPGGSGGDRRKAQVRGSLHRR